LFSDPESRAAAGAWAAQQGLDAARVDFRLCRPEDTRRHEGQYDGMFVKTVFYVSPTLAEYAEWLDWVMRVVRPGGTLINYESGRANAAMQFYRRLRGRVYTDLCLYTGEVEALYRARFDILHCRHYGGLSQFLAPLPGIYEAAAWVESAVDLRVRATMRGTEGGDCRYPDWSRLSSTGLVLTHCRT